MLSSSHPRGRERKSEQSPARSGSEVPKRTSVRTNYSNASDREFPRQVERSSTEQAPLHITTCTHIQQCGSHPLSLAGRQVPASPAGGLGPANSKTQTKTQSNHKKQTPTHIRTVSAHGLRSLRIRNTSYRKFVLRKILHAVHDTRTSTEIWLMPVSRVQQMQGSQTFGTRM